MDVGKNRNRKINLTSGVGMLTEFGALARTKEA